MSGILKASQNHDFDSQKAHPYQDDVGPKAWTALGTKLQVIISTVSILLEKKNAIIQSFTNSNCETLLMRKDTRLHVQGTMCFC